MTHGLIYRTLALLGLLFAAIVAIARTSGTQVEPALQAAKSGVVLDAATGKPVEGVYVAVRWLEQTSQLPLLGGKLRGQCVNRVVVRTDAEGRYRIPAARLAAATNLQAGVRTEYFWDLYTYAPGYDGRSQTLAHPRAVSNLAGDQAVVEPVLLGAGHAAPQQRLATLADTLAQFTCHPFAHDAGAIEQSIAAEAAAAACLPGTDDAQGSCATFRHASAQVL
jgi:hypothetical protein